MGDSGFGTPGSGSPKTSATTRSRMSLRSVVRSAMSPPSFSNLTTKSAMASTVAWVAGRPPAMSFCAARFQPRSFARLAVAIKTSLATPVACEARSAKRWATVADAATNFAFSASRASSGITLLSVGSAGLGRVQPAGA